MFTSRLAFLADPGGALHASLAAACSLKSRRTVRSRFCKLLLLSTAACALSANAADVSLAWNANPESDITGYRLSYGTSAGNYSATLATGTTPATTVTGLAAGTTYYFTVAAVNEAGLVSPLSAEISHQTAPPVVPPSANGWTLHHVDSEEALDYPATSAFDGNPATFWHTRWRVSPLPLPPHEIQINLGSEQTIAGFTYLPRQDSYTTGNIGNFEFYTSMDGENWGSPAASGTFANDATLKEIRFASRSVRFIRLRGLTEANGNTECTVAELDIIAGTPGNPNNPPVAVAKSVTTAEDTPLPIALTGTDADSDPLTFAVVTGPAKGTLSGTPPNVTYTPNADVHGSDSFTFRANDGTVNSAAATVSITVTPVNDAPLAVAKSVTTAEDTAVSIALTGTDKDGDTLSFTVLAGPGKGTLTGTPPNLTYTPTPNANGTDSFTFRVSDGTVNSAPATVSITVTPVNDIPLATSASVTTVENSPLAITLTGSDVENSPLTFSVLAQPANGALTGTPPNLTYTPASGFHGSDSFTFRANDGTANSATATISITITKKPPVPGTNVIPRTGWSLKYVDSQETFDAPGTHAFDGNPATFWHTQWRTGNLAPPPHEIQINLGATHSISGFQYLPRQDSLTIGNAADYEFYVSTDGTNWGNPVASGTFANSKSEKQVIFSAKSGRFVRFRVLSEVSGFPDTCVAELNVLAGTLANQAPVANPQTLTVEENSPLPITLGGSDPEGSPLTYTLTYTLASTPAHGSLSGTPPNLSYLPDPGFSGNDQFMFQANDGAVLSALATVSITVTPAEIVIGNLPPAFATSSISASANEDEPFTGQLLATDPNPADLLVFSKISGPAWLVVTPDGTLGGTPAGGDVGTNTFKVKVADPSNASATATLIVRVSNSNDAPSFRIPTMDYPAGTEKIVYRDQSLASTATDPDADKLTYSKASGPAWLVISKSGQLGGTPPSGSAGLNTFTVRATDSAGAFATATLRISIHANTLPLPWNLHRVGMGNVAGAARYKAGTFTVAGAGALGKTTDAGNFGWQTLSGDGQITARVSKLDDTGKATRVGVMIRQSLAPNSRQVFIGVDGKGDHQWLRRAKTGGKSSKKTLKNGDSKKHWLRLVRKNGVITAYKSTDGKDWTKLGRTKDKLPKNCYVGLSVSSGKKDKLNTSKFSNVRVQR